MYRILLIGFLLGVSALLFAPAASSAGPMEQASSANLRCEYLVDPLGIDEPTPRLSWTFEFQRRGDVQRAYQVLVASSPDLLARGEGDLWDTGRVASRAMQVVYAGKPLKSRQVCYWQVLVWGEANEVGLSGPSGRWEMGLLAPSEWSAKWIEAGPSRVDIEVTKATYAALDGSVSKDVTDVVAARLAKGEPVRAANEALGGDPAVNKPKRLTLEYTYKGAAMRAEAGEGAAPVLPTERLAHVRTSFTAAKPVARARLYVTALGLYEMQLNGERIGDQHLAPGWTDYRKRVQYQVYDVTDRIRVGENAVGATVAPGWFSGRAGLFHARRFYGQTPALLAQLEVTYADGSVERVVTDRSWVRHGSAILLADLMDGEVHDARDRVADWCVPGAAVDGWQPVTEREESRTLVAQMDQPVRALRDVPAKAVTEPAPGRWTFDLGENMVGVVRLRLRAPRGTVLTLRHAEMLRPDGVIYTDNLRGAAATDVYICNGGDEEVWQPAFTLHGFRYVELTGLSEKPALDAITGVILGSDLPSAGEFSCSDERLNTLQANILRGLHGNYVSVPTDCPQRDERMGWMADTQVFVPTAAYNVDVAPFLTKWMHDVTDAQREDGAHSDVAPVMKGLTYGTPAWADAGTIVPWSLYEVYGDERILERNIESMIRWVDWCREHSTGLIRDRDRGNDYGDWLAIGADTPKDLIGTAYFARSAQIVAKSLRVLKRDSEAEKYEALAGDVRAAFAEKYIDAQGRVAGNTQCGYVMALRFGLVPESLRTAAYSHLLADIESRGWRLSTGFVGVGLLLPTLSEGGHDAAAYRLLMQDAFPSWLFSVRHGATTIWERWDGWTPERGVHPDASMNSFNHYALGSCGEWLYGGVAGIQLDPERPGFEHVSIRPRTEGPLWHASATYRSIRGEIGSSWQVARDKFTISVQVPGNTDATIVIPARAGTPVRETMRPSGSTVEVDPRTIRRDGDTATIKVGGGRYEFTSTYPVVRSGNPVIGGWYADPEVAALGKLYWIFPTTSAKYEDQLHFDAFSSRDLVRWTKHPDVLKASSISWAKRAMWAPSIIKQGEKYYLFFSANDIQKDGEVGGIGVAVSTSPAGPFTDHIGKPLVDKFHNGAQPIDQFVFRDDDGVCYMLYGGWGHCNIVRLHDSFRSLTPIQKDVTFKEITPEGYVEGPFMFKRAGKYYFMWSEGGWTGPDYSVAYAIGDSPIGPFKRIAKILTQDPAIATGAGHHSIVRVPSATQDAPDEYAIVYHRRPLGETDRNHRVVCIDKLEFDADGLIRPVRMTFEGLSPAPLPR